MAILKELRRYSSQKSIRGLSHSSTSRPFSTRSKIKLTGARANRVTHRRSQVYDREDEILNYFVNRSTNASAESLNAKIKDFRAQLRGVIDKKFFIFRLVKIFG